jgi:hypothetical protein
MKYPALLALPLIFGACSQEPQPPVANDSAERPTAPGPEAPLPTPVPSPSASPVAAETGTIPARFRGEWNRVAADCGTGRNDSRLRIEPMRLRFHESSGEVVSVRGEGRTIAVRARHTGEGETWEADRSFTLSGDGKTLTSDGMARTRCP